ncbi:MAG TPA: Ig-like domain-containing protein, partial [Kofleriaceae bacterium]|nr:Ig-like domain-containing protein [Kofleriaceae bacterium]
MLAFVALVAGCYNAPSPTCGFICGTGGSCPGGYTCNDNDRRCHLDGTFERCQEYADADIPSPAPYPMVIGTSPTQGDQGIAINTAVTATFNVPIQNVNTMTFTLDTDGAPISGVASATDTVATFLPDHLPSGKLVHATITRGVTDDSTRSVPMFTWTFGVETDTALPTVTGSMPIDGQTGVPTSGQLVTILFSEDVQSIDNLEISIGGVPIPGSWFYEIEQPLYVAQFEPFDGLLPQKAVIDVAAPATITDYAGNALVPFAMQFTTLDEPPFVLGSLPMTTSINVPTDTTIAVTFSEPVMNVDATTFTVNNGLVTGTFASNPDGSVWTFTPDATLPAATEIDVA